MTKNKYIDEQIERQFQELGFHNYQDFLSSGEPTPELIVEGMKIPNAIILDDIYSDPDEIGYIFIVGRNDADGVQYLHSINASCQLETTRKLEGVTVIGNTYLRDNGAFPTKDQIRKEVLEKVRLEKIQEKFSQREKHKAGRKNKSFK
ncbi:hypothetical protein [Chitinophaga cymbidii]|uniref:Uncharacterized protein n=1 Tax=Chitinophaga cymbidii TaxID=1096750 RepID=A0A512RFQ0_9BACT|nr:hypothetical protein [Chitinophaga cymbidii]GEP94536.1 hypothetical protein CCY01nite_07960 [Chitinophaga cymbidii]